MAGSDTGRGSATAPGLVAPDSDAVRELRQRKGWTQEDLANESGRSKGSIEAIENAGRLGRRVQVRTLADVAAALEVSVASLLVGPEAVREPENHEKVPAGPAPVSVRESDGPRTPRTWRWWWYLTAGALAAATAIGWIAAGRPLLTFIAGPPVHPELPDRPAVAILPFSASGLDPDDLSFCSGMIEELTTRLATVPGLFVVSHSAASTYGEKAADPRRIGQELGVHYVIEGAVRAQGKDVRVTARVVDTRTGGTVWSDGFDATTEDILTVQSRIAQRIVVSSKVEIEAADMARLQKAPTSSGGAHEAVLRALFHLSRGTRAGHAQAVGHLERALTIDSRYADAYALLGSAAFIEYASLWSLDRAALDRAVELSLRALDLDSANHQAFITLANAYSMQGRASDALSAAKHAVQIDPNGEWSHAALGLAWLQNGRPLAALRAMNDALRRNPRRPTMILMPVAVVNFLAGRKDVAARIWEQLRNSNPDLIAPRIPLASYYEKRGRHAEARALANEILAANGGMTAEAAVAVFPQLARLIGDDEVRQFKLRLQRAGLP